MNIRSSNAERTPAMFRWVDRGGRRTSRFRTAAFEDLRRSFEDVSEEGMRDDFNRWVTQPGAPALKVSALETISEGDGWVLRARLEQSDRYW